MQITGIDLRLFQQFEAIQNHHHGIDLLSRGTARMPDADSLLVTEGRKQFVFNLLPDKRISEQFGGMNRNLSHDQVRELPVVLHPANHLLHIKLQFQQDPVEASLKRGVGVIREVEVRMVPNSKLKVLYILSKDLHWVNLTI